MQKSIDISIEAYWALATLADEEEGETGRFVALKRLASRLILERAGMCEGEKQPPTHLLNRRKKYLRKVRVA